MSDYKLKVLRKKRLGLPYGPHLHYEPNVEYPFTARFDLGDQELIVWIEPDYKYDPKVTISLQEREEDKRHELQDKLEELKKELEFAYHREGELQGLLSEGR